MLMKVALCQNRVFPHKKDTLANICSWVEKAGQVGSKLCLLGECCNSFYVKEHLHKNAEEFDKSETLAALGELATKHGMFVAGSMPETQGGRFYNSGFVVGPGQGLILHYRKTHLFDVDLPTRTYRESDMFSPGNEVRVADLGGFKLGLGVCYDIRFPELALKMASMGADMLVYPSLFSMPTGPVYF
jgi:omega-amidase